MRTIKDIFIILAVEYVTRQRLDQENIRHLFHAKHLGSRFCHKVNASLGSQIKL